jgi:cytochrome P450
VRDPVPRPPGPSWSAVDAYRRRRRDILGMLTDVAGAHPRLAHLRLLNTSTYLVNDPELVREVFVVRARSIRKGPGLQRAKPFVGTGLLTNEGETHRKHRRLLQPAFHKVHIDAYGHQMVAAAQRLAWADGVEIDIAEQMCRLSLTVATETLFGTGLTDRELADTRVALNQIISTFRRRSAPAMVARAPGPVRHVFGGVQRRFDALLSRLIECRQRQPGTDLLSMLVHSGLSDLEIRHEAKTFVTAGHETIANALTWTWWLLYRHPAVTQRVRAEVDALGGPVTAADYARLPYTRAAVAESMRLYPPVHLIGRRALEPFTLDGWTVPAGDRLLASPWMSHRDARWWGPDVALFRPQRWLDAAGGFADGNPGQPRFAYFPFGAGPRMCIGEGFAWMEMVLVVATLIRRWQLVITRDPRPRPGFSLRTDGPVPAVPRRRDGAHQDAHQDGDRQDGAHQDAHQDGYHQDSDHQDGDRRDSDQRVAR